MNAAASAGCGCNTPPAPGQLHIRHLEDLERLTGLIPSYQSVHVRLMNRSMQDNQLLEQRIMRDYLECGCANGALALKMGAVIALLVIVAWWVIWGSVNGRAVMGVFALVGTASLVAKFATVLIARWRLACSLRALREALS